MRKLNLGLMALLAWVISSCGNSETIATNGLKYTLIASGEGATAENGEFILMNMRYTDQNDSTWMNTADNGFPVVLQKDSTWAMAEGSIYSIFSDLKKGDSAQFSIGATQLFSKTFKAPMPPSLDSTSTLTFQVGIAEIYDREGFQAWQIEMQQKQQQKEEEGAAQQLEEDIETIDKYLSENNIEAQKTESGISYVITEEGSGENASSGSTVKVNYTGYVLNGEYFDSSVEEVAKEKGLYTEGRDYGPFEFQLGTGSVIKGWDEGIALLNKGSKATLYIPSPLAYGPRQRSAQIGANSILVFDVELIDFN
ncbi:peptidylprolyl isomerase [Fulvivirga sp. M361]|uniref:FKBP-type peptidyl-prolyl cis-trans isomerase n=1 Tax=Fulvivirga sp. M361 TaxID=2594266 RepID=UPI001179CA38|nr:FKBP-type peptidyl-prolyl cis-trans isomerase [Fulvivirga sp. M361]TRX61264.1 peptidylprolyl isomerase [Fulvivirga sp. M361]